MPTRPPTAVTLGPDGSADASLAALAADAADARGDVAHALELAVRWGTVLPAPGRGRTALLWEALATLGAVDLTVARVVEPHLDALAILDEPLDPSSTSPATGCGGSGPRRPRAPGSVPRRRRTATC